MKISLKPTLFAVVFCIMVTGFLFSVQEEAKKSTLTKKDHQQVVKKIIPLLKDNYVFLEQAVKMGNHLNKQLRKGAFKSYTDPESFAKAVTKEMWSVFEDRHLRVRVRQPRQVQRQKRDPILDGYLNYQRLIEDNFGFKTVKILDGNIGYLDFRFFGSVDRCGPAAAAAMKFIENTDAVIIDMRKNGGGSPAMVQYVCSFFFDKKVHLNSLYYRKENTTQEFWTLDEIPGKKRSQVPLFVLTSKRTFSGAEEFSYNMLTQKRATLVGEVTGGGANPGGGFPINDKFVIFVPTGRAINPITKTNWEGTGVEPHIKVDAEKALDKAHEEAKKAAKEFRDTRMVGIKDNIKKLQEDLTKASVLLKENKTKAAEEIVFSALKRGQDQKLLTESLINQLGYLYMGQKKMKMAVGLFAFNVKAYPKSWNVYDSLAEALMENGQLEAALKYYQKSIDLNPQNSNGKTKLQELKEKLAKKK